MAVNYSSILWFYGFKCFGGGKFYICKDAKTEFVGCCESDPCEGGKGVCPKGKLRHMSFSQSLLQQEYPPLSCDDPAGRKKWYTCESPLPLFTGCCRIQACAHEDGCPMNETIASTLPVDESLRRKFLEPEIDYESSASSAPYPAPESTQSFKFVDMSDSDWASEITLGPGTVAGICASVLVIVLLLLGFLWRCRYVFVHDPNFSHHGTDIEAEFPQR